MDKKTFLKISGHKSLKSFYAAFPDEQSFLAKHGKTLKKLMREEKVKNAIPTAQGGFTSDPEFMKQFNTMNQGAPSIQTPLFNPSQLGINNTLSPGQNMSTAPKKSGWDTANSITSGIPLVGNIIGGFKALHDEKNQVKEMQKAEQLSALILKASQSAPRMEPRKWNRPDLDRNVEDINSLMPAEGTGSNMLGRNGIVLQGGGEIQNTYAPNTLYANLGYEPLGESEKVKSYQAGGFMNFMGGQGGSSLTGMIRGGINAIPGMGDAGGQLGGAIGNSLSMIPGIGTVLGPVAGLVGQTIGGLVDRNDDKIEKAKKKIARNEGQMFASQVGNALQTQFAGNMRTGGNLRSNVPDMEQNGELKVLWGGHAQPISDNPYMEGQSIEFKGNSHKDGGMGVYYGENGANSPKQANVEVENEPADEIGNNLVVWGALKIPKESLEYIGDRDAKGKSFKGFMKSLAKTDEENTKKIEKATEELTSLNPKNTFDKIKFDTLSLTIKGADEKLKKSAETRQKAATVQQLLNQAQEEEVSAKKGESIPKAQVGIQKREEETPWDDLYPNFPYKRNHSDVVEPLLSARYANFPQQGVAFNRVGNSNQFITQRGTWNESPGFFLKQVDNINRLAEHNYEDAITKNMSDKEYDMWENRYNIPSKPTEEQVLATAMNKSRPSSYPSVTNINFGDLPEVTREEYNELLDLYSKAKSQKRGAAVKAFQKRYHELAPEYAQRIIDKYPETAYGKSKKLGKTLGSNEDELFGERTIQYMNALRKPGEIRAKSLPTPLFPIEQPTINPQKVSMEQKQEPTKPPLMFPPLNYLPSRSEPLDPRQLTGEYYSLATNQLEPVPAQQYHPQLRTPYDISLQDIMNENTATTRGAQKLMGYDPAAQSNLVAQQYGANEKVLGEQFRQNQGFKDKIYGENVNILNDAQLKNLGILDTQYGRQAQALSNTKAISREALSSISDKYLQHDKEEDTLGMYRNLYNYRPDKQGHMWNLNWPAQFNMQGSGNDQFAGLESLTPEERDVAVAEARLRRARKDYSGSKEKARNGAILKAIRNL